MRVIRSWQSADLTGVVLTIGNFDGVHRGHQAILAAGRRRADTAKSQLVAMTFDPHPLAILTPGYIPPTLTPIDEKLRLLREAGADQAVVVRSCPEFLGMSADEFIREVIVNHFHPVAMVEGANFGFGHKRQGDVRTLTAGGARHGFEVEVVQQVRAALSGHPDAVISSSLIRQLLTSGAVEQAALCLGRPYTLVGRVGRGKRRGRTLGYPTANIDIAHQLVPGEGVYAGTAYLETEHFATAVSIGRNTTFEGRDLTVEAHLLGFEGDLYDRPVRIDLIEWIRPQQQFRSADELSAQIAKDLGQIVRIIAESGS